VTGTSKPELNGQKGRATGYNSETFRYNVALDNGRTVSLKVANLIAEPADEDSGGGGGFAGMPQMPGMPDLNKLLAMLPPWLVTKLTRGEMPTLSDVERLLPDGVTMTHIGGVVVVLLLMMFKVGIFKTIIFATFVGYIAFTGFPSFKEAGGGIDGLKRAGTFWGQKLSDQIFFTTQQRISTNLSLGALGALAVAVLYYVLLDGLWGGATAGAAFTGSGSYSSGGGGGSSSLAEQAYAEGYEDAVAGREPNWAGSASHRYASAARTTSSGSGSAGSSPPPSSGGWGLPSFGGFGIGKLFSLGLLGRQVWGLGAVPGGGWDMGLAQVNLVNMPTMQKVFFGMNLLRLLGMSPI